MHGHTHNYMLVGDEATEYFDVQVCVRQIYMLSSILCSIFINGLARELEKSGVGIEIRGKKIASLLYADDIVLVAESEEELKEGMKIVT